ncbi:glycosyltransferase family 10 [Helicobacter bilis]|uniref:glycosyltransferase family 10 domain-containing protein n=1 Tax=Helicobacter bilis TaxID=37372 RepID=UPI00248E18FC|nr:glycosyltransferase family 10 [Helicobacter bilis]
MVSNNALTDKRDMFFEALSKYKRVDSGGRWKNNIGGNVDDKIEWLKSYKFNLCFENSSYPGYLTEKLFDAFLAGCVPIYWGDTSLKIHKNTCADSKNSENINNRGGGVMIPLI